MNTKFPIFLNDWSQDHVTSGWREDDNTPIKQVAYDFQVDIEFLEELNILVATYTYQNYEGSAFVLYESNGKLYEVNGSHCSCYGLEGQWIPEEASLDEMEHRLTEGTFGRSYGSYDWDTDSYTYENVFAEELLEVVRQLKLNA